MGSSAGGVQSGSTGHSSWGEELTPGTAGSGLPLGAGIADQFWAEPSGNRSADPSFQANRRLGQDKPAGTSLQLGFSPVSALPLQMQPGALQEPILPSSETRLIPESTCWIKATRDCATHGNLEARDP